LTLQFHFDKGILDTKSRRAPAIQASYVRGCYLPDSIVPDFCCVTEVLPEQVFCPRILMIVWPRFMDWPYLGFLLTFCVLPFSPPTNTPPKSFFDFFFELEFCICQIYRTPMRGIWVFKTRICVCICTAELVDITPMHISIPNRRSSIPNNPRKLYPFSQNKKFHRHQTW